MKKSIVVCIIMAVLAGCKKEPSLQDVINYDVVIEVSVLLSGEVFADGEKISMSQLDKRFAEISKQNGVVWFYREIGDQKPPAAATEVLELVIKHQLMINISSKPDFSNVVEADGTVSQRKQVK